MNARDRLTADISSATDHWAHPLSAANAEMIAVELEEKGYRKPRTITTVAELQDAQMMVVRTDGGSIANLVNGRAYFFGYEASVPVATLALPATVLHEPQP